MNITYSRIRSTVLLRSEKHETNAGIFRLSLEEICAIVPSLSPTNYKRKQAAEGTFPSALCRPDNSFKFSKL